jgi:hypothetical protein
MYLFGLEKAAQNVENAQTMSRPPGSSARHFMALRTTRHSGRRTFISRETPAAVVQAVVDLR